jgi:hypothetical protein
MGLRTCRYPWMSGFALQLVLLAVVSGFADSATGAQRGVAVSRLVALSPGVTLPVQLSRSLYAGKVPVGTRIVAKTTQRVPVGEDLYLKRGAELIGVVVASSAEDKGAGRPATLTFEFTQLRYGKQTVPVRTKAIAIANFTDVGETFLPVTGGADRGNASEASWTTKQVGGDEVVRSGWVGDVVGSRMETVGYADYWGVYSLPMTLLGDGTLPRAMGVFSTTAAGLYGFDKGTELHSAGGRITLMRAGGRVLIRSGDNLLLEVM